MNNAFVIYTWASKLLFCIIIYYVYNYKSISKNKYIISYTDFFVGKSIFDTFPHPRIRSWLYLNFQRKLISKHQ